MAIILIVDDHILNRQFLAALLGFDGHQVLAAADGLEALKLVNDERPALVITDILMPRMNGYEFVTRLRADAAAAATPVIFYTSTYSTREARAMARACDVGWVLRKPSAPELISATVREALGLPAPDAAIATPKPAGADRALASIDAQLTRHLQEAESSRQRIAVLTQADSRAPAQRRALLEATQQLSASLAALQSVSRCLTAIIDTGIDMTLERDQARLLETACRMARHICAAKYAVAGIVGPDGAPLRHLAARGLDREAQRHLASLPPPTGLIGAVLSSKVAQRRKDLDGDPGSVGLALSHPPVHSLLAVPIATAEGAYGWIYLVDKLGADEFGEIDERAAVTVATQLAVAYENLVLYDKAQGDLARLEADIAERDRIAGVADNVTGD